MPASAPESVEPPPPLFPFMLLPPVPLVPEFPPLVPDVSLPDDVPLPELGMMLATDQMFLIMTVASAALGTAISIASDMTQGIIDRFRTMAIARAAVLTGHVIGSLLQTLAVLVLVILVSITLGFRPTADPLEWMAALGLLGLFSFALIWLSR